MKVRYYSFDSSIGKLRLYFNEEAIVGLSFFGEGDNYKYIKRYYGDTVEVCKDDYNYHEEVIKYLEGKLVGFAGGLDVKKKLLMLEKRNV